MPSTKHRGADGHYAEKLHSVYRLIDNYTKMLAESMNYDLCQSMKERIAAAGKSARLDACDDRIYDAYIRLVRHYRDCAAQYEAMSDVLVSPRIRNITQGIEAVVRSRIGPGELTENFAENPIFLEKKRILGAGMDAFERVFMALGDAFVADELPACMAYARELFITLDEIDYPAAGTLLAQRIAERQDSMIGTQIGTAYREAVQSCVEQLNDIGSRTEILRYSELLEKEHEILDSIVKIQVPQLERDRACSPMEAAAVESILAPIVEACTILADDIASIRVDFAASQAAVVAQASVRPAAAEALTEDEGFTEDDTFTGSEASASSGTSTGDEPPMAETRESLWEDQMLRFVLAATNYEGFAHCLKTEFAEVCHSLEQDIGILTEREISNRLYARAMYEYRKQATAHALVADELIAAFERLVAAGRAVELPEAGGEAADEERSSVEAAILGGIIETLDIKIESLRENREMFCEETADKLKQLRRERPRIALQDLGEITPEIDPERRAVFFERCRQQRQRHILLHQEYADKKCTAFKREVLLFEIITFEEIMHYSVSRLREGEHDTAGNDSPHAMGAFIRCVDETWDTLQDILNKNRITSISPAAHEIFNGREHEVLMAEKNSEFKKGEIIKLMNRGYKQDGVVLVRANVVAAI